MRIRDILKTYYRLQTILKLRQVELQDVRDEIARNEARLLTEFPSYGVASLNPDSVQASGDQDKTFLLMLRFQSARREIEKALTGLYADEEERRQEIDGLQREARRVSGAISMLDANGQQLVYMRYKEEKSLQAIALELYDATEPSTARYHLLQIEEQLRLMLDRNALILLQNVSREPMTITSQRRDKKPDGSQLVLVRSSIAN